MYHADLVSGPGGVDFPNLSVVNPIYKLRIINLFIIPEKDILTSHCREKAGVNNKMNDD